MGAPFTARYTSDCDHCGELIEPGDDAGYDDNDQVCCKPCWDTCGDNGEYWDA